MTSAIFYSNSPLSAQNCNCQEYLYVSDTAEDAVHKFAVNADGSLTEVGNPWYPGTGTSELPLPHGIAADQAGYLYVDESQQDDGDIRRITCDGEIMPATGPNGWSIPDVGVFNMNSLGNTLYTLIPPNENDYPSSSIQAFDFCTGNHIGQFCAETAAGNNTAIGTWDFHIDPITNDFYSVSAWGNGRLFKFNESDLNGACVTPLLDGVDPFGDTTESVKGITVDDEGYIFVAKAGFGTESQILVFDSSGNFVTKSTVDNTEGDGGWYGALSLNYSATCDCIYTANWTNLDDCVSRFTFDSTTGTLTYDGPAIGPVTGPPGDTFQGKASELITECCPVNNLVIDTALCATSVNEVLYIKDLMDCDGVVCEGPWTPDPANTGMTFDACDNSITITSSNACGSFSNTSDGTSPNSQCGAYSITLAIDVLQNDGVSISGNQTICDGDAPALLTATSMTAGVNYQWQQSTTSCDSGFTEIPGATSSTYAPPVIGTTTYYKVNTSLPGTCSTDTCDAESNCVTVTVQNCCPNPACSSITVTSN